MKIKNNIYLFIFFLFLSCFGDNTETILKQWNLAQEHYENKQYNESLVVLHRILNNSNSKDDIKVKSLFLISEIYLNEYKEYTISISFLNKILDGFPEHDLAKRSLFTKAYINANYIESFSEAVTLYNLFIRKYPDDELISSVNYELNLHKIKIETIQ